MWATHVHQPSCPQQLQLSPVRALGPHIRLTRARGPARPWPSAWDLRRPPGPRSYHLTPMPQPPGRCLQGDCHTRQASMSARMRRPAACPLQAGLQSNTTTPEPFLHGLGFQVLGLLASLAGNTCDRHLCPTTTQPTASPARPSAPREGALNFQTKVKSARRLEPWSFRGPLGRCGQSRCGTCSRARCRDFSCSQTRRRLCPLSGLHQIPSCLHRSHGLLLPAAGTGGAFPNARQRR